MSIVNLIQLFHASHSQVDKYTYMVEATQHTASSIPGVHQQRARAAEGVITAKADDRYKVDVFVPGKKTAVSLY